MEKQRPKIKVKFKYNIETGEVEEFIIDDHLPDANEEYHDNIAKIVAENICCQPDIQDAGYIRQTGNVMTSPLTNNEKKHNRSILCNKT
ncbi:hypothetical protein MHK_000894 [Candidatus Magnetomorum sp. HK-1]|nr:hypothetical protein MHK_000894 [Candidatus Magnetomorum sp. HK-1]